MRDVMNLGTRIFGEAEIEIAAIDVADRLRLVSEPHIEMLAASINEIGLNDAIAVSHAGDGSNRYFLVDGEHRLEACRRLGRTTVRAVVREQTADERLKHEIHANLIRNELNALDRLTFVDRLGAIFEREHPEARNGGDRKSRKFLEKNQFANLANWSAFEGEAARRTGLSTRSVQRIRQLASKLSPEVVEALKRSPIADNHAQIQALAELPPEEQIVCAKALAGGQAKNVEAARIATALVAPRVIDPDEVTVSRFIGLWERASPKARKRIAAHIALAETPAKPPKAKAGT